MARSSNIKHLNNKRKRDLAEQGGVRKRRPKTFRRAGSYHSSSEDEEDVQINIDTEPQGTPTASTMRTANAGRTPYAAKHVQPKLTGANEVEAVKRKAVSDDSDADDDEPNVDEVSDEDDFEGDGEADSGSDSDDAISETTSTASTQRRKRNDPSRFATSISKILDSKLTTTKRADPVLARSKTATEASQDLAESKLEAKAKRKLRDDKKNAMERGRVKDVMGLESTDVSTAEIAEHEKRLRKMAQRGVVKLFNAVRAAQVKGEEATRDVKSVDGPGHLVGADRRTERVNEMSKKGFLDMLAAG